LSYFFTKLNDIIIVNKQGKVNETVENNIVNKEIVFALDIGTRNVVGLLGYEEDGIIHVFASSMYEHKTRAMADGQIHDIEKVSQVIKLVKDDLEKEIGRPLKSCAIAAAGRVLQTETAEVNVKFNEEKEILKTHILALEMQGVEEAKALLEKETEIKFDYMCVAHTVVNYAVDNFVISNLEGHTGREISAKILATFLPKQVIDSLYRSVNMVGLSVDYLTLEPIAAINVAIPESLRMLNLALIDIGAGTSDIAVTKDGTIVSYGMLPIAGDEFSDHMVQHYLMDFAIAEDVKRSLATTDKEKVVIKDILGGSNKVKIEKVIKVLDPITEKLSTELAKKILELNGEEAPKAVFCVGGGSQFPGFTSRLSEKLGLEENKVVLKSIDTIGDHIVIDDDNIKGPEFITPVGICISTLQYKHRHFIDVKINGEEYQMLNTSALTIFDAALKVNFTSDHFMPQNGKRVTYEINGEIKKIRGAMAEPAVIMKNGEFASLQTSIENGDEITLTPSKHGKDAEIRLQTYVENVPETTVVLSGKRIKIGPVCEVNGEVKRKDYIIETGDRIVVKPVETLEEAAKLLKLNTEEFSITLNGQHTSIKSPISEYDKIDLVKKDGIVGKIPVETIGKIDGGTNEILVYVNGEKIYLSGMDTYQLVHILNYVDIDLSKPKGFLQIYCNEEKADYTSLLKDGDKIKLYFEE
jgi:cell division protein FtsA